MADRSSRNFFSGGPATSVSSTAFPLRAPSGTLGAPSYSFSANTGTGIALVSGGAFGTNAGMSLGGNGNGYWGAGVTPSNQSILVGNAGAVLAWVNGQPTAAAPDTSISRTAAASVGIGSGASGSTAGLLIAARVSVNGSAFTVATLPAGVEGQISYATNGRKVGEGAGAGTGVPVYFSNGSWRVFSTDAAVAA